MNKIKEIISALEKLAPPAYQEGYDNSGLIVGDKNWETTGVLISLDTTEAVVLEAIRRNCNLIVSHHPIVFKGLKKLTGSNYVERTVALALKNDIALYAIHTNLDHVEQGVNWKIAQKLGLKNVKILAPKSQLLQKLTTFVPTDDAYAVRQALFAAGAGEVGDYSQCSFSSQGVGTFLPGDSTQPVIGQRGTLEHVNEIRIEVLLPSHLSAAVLLALNAAHPYEEVAYYLQNVENTHQQVGAGAIGELPEALDSEQFLAHLKESMSLPLVKHTAILGDKIKTVALCGGAGSFLLPKALSASADVFITGDYKYHEFFDADQRLMICDIGHYESEVFTKDLLLDYLSGIFSNFALCLSETNTNPVHYYH
ncbi:dinuclear metal center YbgI/SA1388 family protein [Dyadobacter jejuensis]|uniref:GTP cyclohydrolase 1 type 2 homolog n=1 Tax=Dyadobacter jejuensis TaxID=1082580 RepID=A0A316AI32_9BACT|nr:Nif3-like dinuclear metal center hexameric protein [Dyadobacter jejuensis]PWJ57405.1 dinuclear metal center YbgI/SA1388 family protein [Dyadobacter jejuensis]